jgi:GntR family transcriptional regulator, rspAB operon transcriptional repressor
MMKPKLESASLAETAYVTIRDAILRGQRPLGAPLSRRQLAAELNMSVVPVADALQRLESEGLIESRPRVGTRVRVPTAQDIRGHYVVREALESQAARLFAERATADERDEIKRMAARLDTLYAEYADTTHTSEEWFRLHQEHLRFHMRVAECSGYQALCVALERNQILIFNWLYDTAAGRRRMPPNHHGRLARSLCSQDPIVADKAMRLHVAHGRDEVLATLEQVTTK